MAGHRPGQDLGVTDVRALIPSDVRSAWTDCRRFSPGAYLSVKAPAGLLPLLVNGTKGGLSACTYAGPGTEPAGFEKVNLSELTRLSGIFAEPPAPSPPKFTTPLGCKLKKLITVSVENPVPVTVIVLPAWTTESA